MKDEYSDDVDPDLIVCIVCGEDVHQDEYNFEVGICWECWNDGPKGESGETRTAMNDKIIPFPDQPRRRKGFTMDTEVGEVHVTGDPNMDEKTREMLSVMFEMAYRQYSGEQEESSEQT